VQASGEPVRFNFYGEERPNQNPTAGIQITKTSKNTIRARATGSFDPDGTIVDYLWDFGDGMVETGPDVTHRFAEAGDYRVTLIVKDDDGGLGFGNAATHFVLTPYAFSGFNSPVEDRPTVNKANAGSAIPVKFSLGGDQGMADVQQRQLPVRVEDGSRMGRHLPQAAARAQRLVVALGGLPVQVIGAPGA
jgi:hypothetical protein